MSQLISIQLGRLKNITFNGKKIKTGIFKDTVKHPVLVKFLGIKDDYIADLKNHGGYDMALYAYGMNSYDKWKILRDDHEFIPGKFGENFTFDILDEEKVFVGDIFNLGNCILQACQPRIPCYKLGAKFNDRSIIKDFNSNLMPGIYFRVLKEGIVKKEDMLIYKENKEEYKISIKHCFSLLNDSSLRKKFLDKALNLKFLAINFKKQLKISHH